MRAATSSVYFRRGSSVAMPDSFIADRGPDAPLLVAIHGISRNAAEIAARFAADPRFDEFTICAPLFERHRFGKYQQMVARPGRVPSDLALMELLDALGRAKTAKPSRIALFGFSGGAQMAHRFAMLHPDRVNSVFAVAAGWYLMPDHSLVYPHGLADALRLDNVTEAYLELPITIAAGTLDTRIDDSVRQDEIVHATQGKTRLCRAKSWVNAMQQRAAEKGVPSQVRFVPLPNGTHDFGQCVRDACLLDVAVQAFCTASL